MKIVCCTAVFVLAMAATNSAHADLPKSGVCTHSEIAALYSSVEWSGDEATVTAFGHELSGKVVGMRSHDKGFKFSIVYEDRFVGPTEIVIFSQPSAKPPSFRSASVSFDTLDDGARVIAIVSGFEAVDCKVEM